MDHLFISYFIAIFFAHSRLLLACAKFTNFGAREG